MSVLLLHLDAEKSSAAASVRTAYVKIVENVSLASTVMENLVKIASAST